VDTLITAINAKWPGSALDSAVGGRVFLDQAPAGCEFPYVVWFIVSGVPDRTFTEHYTDALIQFSIFSASPGAVVITSIYNALVALFDECILTITGSTLVWMRETNMQTMVEDITVGDGTQSVKAWHVDFEVRTSLN